MNNSTMFKSEFSLLSITSQQIEIFEESCADVFKYTFEDTAEVLRVPAGLPNFGCADDMDCRTTGEAVAKTGRAKPLTEEQLLERVRLNAPLWQNIESAVKKYCGRTYGDIWEDVASETMFRFLRYNNVHEDDSSSYHIYWCKINSVKAYRDLGNAPRFKAGNSRGDDEKEYGMKVRLVSYEALVEDTAFDIQAREVDLDMLLRKKTFLESDVVPEKHKQVFELWCLGISDLEISRIIGNSRVRITQIRKAIAGYVEALGLRTTYRPKTIDYGGSNAELRNGQGVL